MSEAFSILSSALDEAIADARLEKAQLKQNTMTIEIEAPQEYTPVEIKAIRKAAGVTQKLFAKYFGVSCKTVEAWEAGRNKPSGPSSRLLGLLDNQQCSIVG